MRFEHPHLLWLLLLTMPALTAFFWWSWRTRRRLIAQFVQSRLLANLTVGVSARRQKARMILIVISVALLIIVSARPQWGFAWEEARQRGLDIVVAIDTSRSMLAEDVTPNRLARAKLAALDLKKLARTDRVGLVAFAGTAFLQCPLSFDEEAFRQSLNALDVNIIPQGGSALAEAIQTAQTAFKEKNDNHRILVLFTDGEDHDGNALEVAKNAAKNGMRIFTVGVGTGNGELLRITDGKGRTDYVRDSQGNVVKSRLNESLLRELAQAADGFYMLLTGANTIELLYERGLAPLPKTELTSRRIKRFHERYQWLLGLTLVLLLLEMFLPERKRVPKTEAMLAATNPQLRKAVTTALLLFAGVAAMAAASSSEAKRLYVKGKYKQAQREYERLLEKSGSKGLEGITRKLAEGKQEEAEAEIGRALEKGDLGDPRLHFNTGAAAYQAGDFENAAMRFVMAATARDLKLQEQAFYNLGNSFYRLGEQTEDSNGKMEAWQESIQRFEAALKLNPQDADAKFNLDVVKQKLEELKKQQQQQQKSKDDKKDDSKQDEQSKKDQQEQKQDQQKPESGQDQKPNQEQQQQEQKKPENQKPESQPQEQAEKKEGNQSEPKDQGERPEDQKQAGSPPRAVQMTPQEAQRLLETLKSEEKAMIFTPQLKTNRANRVFKDW